MKRSRHIPPPRATRSLARPAVLAAALLLPGCERLWVAGNRAPLTSDVGALVARAGLAPAGLDCRMLGATRDAECRFRAAPGAVGAFVKALALEPAGEGAPSGLDRLAARVAPAALAPAPAGLEVFAASGRPKSLRLESGSAFEYLVLFHDPARGEVWLRLSYAYG